MDTIGIQKRRLSCQSLAWQAAGSSPTPTTRLLFAGIQGNLMGEKGLQEPFAPACRPIERANEVAPKTKTPQNLKEK